MSRIYKATVHKAKVTLGLLDPKHIETKTINADDVESYEPYPDGCLIHLRGKPSVKVVNRYYNRTSQNKPPIAIESILTLLGR